MAKLITIPNFSTELNPSKESSSITKIIWHKKINDFVKTGEIICSIETKKAVLEAESSYEGHILFLNNKTQVKYLDSLCVIGNKGESYEEVLNEYEKSRTFKETPFTIENIFETLVEDQIKPEEKTFSWLRNFFK